MERQGNSVRKSCAVLRIISDSSKDEMAASITCHAAARWGDDQHVFILIGATDVGKLSRLF
jgi:hypothetical protein